MPKLSIYFIRAALLHLGVGFSIAALLLANKGIPFSAEIWRLIEPHVQILIFGWMLQLAMGVAFYALPRFSNIEARYGNERLGWCSFALLNGCILLTIVGAWFSHELLSLAGRLGLLIAVSVFLTLIWSRVKPLGGFAASQNG